MNSIFLKMITAVTIVNKGFQKMCKIDCIKFYLIVSPDCLLNWSSIFQGKWLKKIFYKKPSLPLI
jgi:hypothetical protein